MAGNYTINIVNAENGCAFSNWQSGSQAQVNLKVVQSEADESVTGTVEGVTGGVLTLLFGSNVFRGTADGSAVDLALNGTRAANQGACAFTAVARLQGTLDEDTLSGTIRYTYNTNNSPDCATLATCSSVQNFNGIRPPTE